MPGKGAKPVEIPLPGADPKTGQVVDFPLSMAGDKVMTENGGRKLPCTPGVMKGLVKQLPKATIHVTPPNSLPAHRVARVLAVFHTQARAGAVAFLPVREITMKEAKERKEAKDAVDRAFGGGTLGGLGGGKQ
jgi:hypothetical protein